MAPTIGVCDVGRAEEIQHLPLDQVLDQPAMVPTMVDNAHDRAHRPSPNTRTTTGPVHPVKVVAELSFRYWRYLLTARYEVSLRQSGCSPGQPRSSSMTSGTMLSLATSCPTTTAAATGMPPMTKTR